MIYLFLFFHFLLVPCVQIDDDNNCNNNNNNRLTDLFISLERSCAKPQVKLTVMKKCCKLLG